MNMNIPKAEAFSRGIPPVRRDHESGVRKSHTPDDHHETTREHRIDALRRTAAAQEESRALGEDTRRLDLVTLYDRLKAGDQNMYAKTIHHTYAKNEGVPLDDEREATRVMRTVPNPRFDEDREATRVIPRVPERPVLRERRLPPFPEFANDQYEEAQHLKKFLARYGEKIREAKRVALELEEFLAQAKDPLFMKSLEDLTALVEDVPDVPDVERDNEGFVHAPFRRAA